jgi:alkanesulfonate monooxygenase SsuD/methylene tetrahydromethanopterin reductase-like flavin-dependent oxidoreductase (luciferase family)
MTMDHLTGGRVLLGIGTSNPQMVEGWYGQPYPRPLERTREYVDVTKSPDLPYIFLGPHNDLGTC